MATVRRQVEIVYTTPRSEETRRSIEGIAQAADVTRRRIVSSGAESSRALQQMSSAAAGAREQMAEMERGGLRGAGNFRAYGSAAQQAGYQVGDFAVQVASGQNAMVAATQQLSQLLGAFGTWGAVVGAAAAVAGGLAIAFVDTRSASERFEEGLKALRDQLAASNGLLKETETGLTNVADAFSRADAFQRQLIRSNLEESVRKGTAAIREQAAAIRELTAEQGLFATISGSDYRPSTATGIFRPAEGLSRDQAFRVSESLRAFEQSDGGLDAAKAFAAALIEMRRELDGSSPAFTEFADQLLVAIEESVAAGKSVEGLKAQLAALGTEIPKNIEALRALDKAFTESSAASERMRASAVGLLESYSPLLAAKNEAYAKVIQLRDAAMAGAIGWDEYEAAVAGVRREFERSQDPLGTVIEGLKVELSQLQLSDAARRQAVRVQAEYNAAVKNGAPATEATRQAIEREVVAIISQEQANAAATAAAAEAERARESERQQLERLIATRATAIADLQSELTHQVALREAHESGAAAVHDVTTAREAELIVQRLKLEGADAEVGLIEDLVRRIGEQRRAIEGVTTAQKEAEKAAERLAREQVKAAEDAVRAYEKVLDDIREVSQQALGDALFDHLRGETLDFAEFMKDTLLRAVSDIAASILTQQIVMPLAVSAVGAVPGLFGLSGQAAGVAQSAGGGGMFGGGFNPLSLLNSGSGGGLYNQFAFSSIGQSLGLSMSSGAAAAAGLGVTAATPAATLALSGPLGGMGTVAGAATASTGGMVGAAGLGGAAPGLTALGAAAPLLLAAAAIALPLLGGLFGGNPSVGPVGVADFAPGLGRGREFDQPLIDPFTSDNGGNGEAMRPIAEAIAEIIADSADRFAATIDGSLRFRVANYQGPESGSGRAAGFEVNAFIRGQAEDRIAEGLSQEQAIFEALRFAVTEAFKFDSATMAEIAANTAADTTEELLADLEFGRNFDMLSEALSDLGGAVNANTLAAAQLQVAIINQAEEFARGATDPIIDGLRRAIELFPAMVEREVTRRETVRGVFTPGNIEGGGGRFVEEGSDEFDRLTQGDNALPVITQIRGVDDTVEERSRNFGANMERVGRQIDVTAAAAALLGDQITGAFEPTARGPFQADLEQTVANIEALRDPFEEMNDLIRDANEAFPDLNRALIDVDATIADLTATAIEIRQERFRDDLTRRQNAATGLGGLNVIEDLVTGRDTMLSDAAALGIQFPQDGPNAVRELFDAELRQALSGASLDELGRLLSSGQIADAGARAIVETILQEQALAAVRQDQLAGLTALQAETEAFASAANDNARRLRQAAAGLLVDPNLSPLSRAERLAEARRQFDAALAVANDADPSDAASQEAIERLPDLSQTLLQVSREYYASSAGYLEEFARVQDALGSTALRQETIEERQLSALRDIEAAIIAAGGATAGMTPAERAAAGGFNFGSNTEANQRIYNALSAAGLATPSGFGSGQLGALRGSNPAVDALLRAMGFAAGGLVTGGVPGRDSVPAMLMPGERVFSVPHSRMLERLAANDGGGGGQRELLAELRLARAEAAAMRGELAMLREVVADSGNLNAEATREVSRTIDLGRRDMRQRPRLGAAAS